MCAECRLMSCDPRCPYAPEPRGVHTCDECGNEIFAGERFVRLGGRIICRSCLEEMTVEELLSLAGYELETAEEMEDMAV